MALSTEREARIRALCTQMRRALIQQLHGVQTGHPGGSLSCTEILTLLYQEKLHIDAANPKMPGRDYFILSKGHAAPMLYLNLAEKGFFPKEELPTLRQMGSILQGHPCAHKTPGVELSTGPLGLGLAAGLGMALSQRLQGFDNRVYVLLGDGEIQEGAVWEAAMSASKFAADNLIGILDNNGVQLDGTLEEVMPMGNIGEKFAAFGWRVLECDGHDIGQLSDTLDQARERTGRPTMVIAKTVKGKGVSFMEGKNTWHGKAIGDEDYQRAMAELGGECHA